MNLLSKAELLQYYESEEPESLFIEPLLNKNQIGNFTIDLRLGYDFLVSIMTRKPSIELIPSKNNDTHQPIRTFSRKQGEILGIDSLFTRIKWYWQQH